MSEKSLKNLLNPNDDKGLGEIVKRAQAMDSLGQALRDALHPDYGAAIASATLSDDGELVVLAISSAWAARMRFETESILNAAVDAGYAATTCRVRVNRG